MYAIIQNRGRQTKVTPGGFVMIDGTAGEPGDGFGPKTMGDWSISGADKIDKDKP